jgi:hypothetical protein
MFHHITPLESYGEKKYWSIVKNKFPYKIWYVAIL